MKVERELINKLNDMQNKLERLEQESMMGIVLASVLTMTVIILIALEAVSWIT